MRTLCEHDGVHLARGGGEEEIIRNVHYIQGVSHVRTFLTDTKKWKATGDPKDDNLRAAISVRWILSPFSPFLFLRARYTPLSPLPCDYGYAAVDVVVLLIIIEK